MYYFSYKYLIDHFSAGVRLPSGGLQCLHRAGQCWSVDLLHPGPGQGLGGGAGLVADAGQQGRGGDTLRGPLPGHLGRSDMFTAYKWSKLSMLKTC